MRIDPAISESLAMAKSHTSASAVILLCCAAGPLAAAHIGFAPAFQRAQAGDLVSLEIVAGSFTTGPDDIIGSFDTATPSCFSATHSFRTIRSIP
jgi:hypothetical protein